MTAKPNYFKLGLFILLALTLLVIGVVLFGSGVFAKEKTFFESYFADPVTGLVPGSPVLEQGVQIGVVESISFVRHDYPSSEVEDPSSPYRSLVRVICSVQTGRVPEVEADTKVERTGQKHLNELIDNGLRLQLSTNLLTGQGYIEAGYLDPRRFPVEPFPWEAEHLFIPSAPSDFTTMKDSVDKILQRLEQIETEKIAKNINDVLVSVDKAVNDADVGAVREEAVKLLTELRQTNQDLKKLLENPTPQQDLANVAELVDQMNITLTRIDQIILSRSPQVLEMLENFKQMSEHLKNMTEEIDKSPSVIFSQPPENKERVK
ncbi:MAG: MlaD/PqiB family protein [Planctomycetota bacterium]|jgi:paraquat-inducible protein B